MAKSKLSCGLDISRVLIGICLLFLVSACAKSYSGSSIVPINTRTYSPIERLLQLSMKDDSFSFFQIECQKKQKYDLLIKASKGEKWHDIAARRGISLNNGAVLSINIHEAGLDKVRLEFGVSDKENTFILSAPLSISAGATRGIDLLADKYVISNQEIVLAHVVYTSTGVNENIIAYAPNEYLRKPLYAGAEYLFVLKPLVE